MRNAWHIVMAFVVQFYVFGFLFVNSFTFYTPVERRDGTYYGMALSVCWSVRWSVVPSVRPQLLVNAVS